MAGSMDGVRGNLGILVGGGPAPGLNGVIAAVTIEARRNNLKVYGIYEGYKWLVNGDEGELLNHVRELRISDVSRIHFDGGSILRTSRTNPVNTENGVANTVNLLGKLGIKYMVTIGGDDTAYGASEIAKAAGGEIKFAHVPKTIDNDLPLPHNIPTFGYQTARNLGAILVKNLMEDARVTGRWYVTIAMGRHAGHLALGIAKSSGATAAIIAEEFGDDETIPLKKVCDIFEGSILKRMAMGHNHGVMIIAEGVAMRFSAKELENVPGTTVEYDAYGHLRLAEVDLGKLIKQEMQRRTKKHGYNITLVDINIGYVLRCADPIPFDQEYTRDLGYNAVKYLLSNDPAHQKNAMICVDNGELTPMPFDKMIDPKTHKTAVRMVDIKSESYRVAGSYMVRLEKRDFADEALVKKMAAAANMSVEEFIEEFGYTVN